MEVIQEYLIPALQNANKYIPPSISFQALSYYSTITTHFHPISQQYLQPYLLTPLQTVLNSPPDLTSFLVLCVILFISLKVLNYARRVITFWVMLVFRLAFWGSVIGGAYYVYVVGWERAGREARWLLGLLQGFVEELWANRADGQGQAPPIYGGMRREQARKRTGWN
ncbi:hypothetical protein EMCG_01487 [[Emmonsia] crescens]|uniref:Nuclear pore assembly and biogenesis-domain-containing protein n=1 Tax=[Emmonsia] crescens TaxID=73230 RepID=A0A0G2I0S2_9EURO|nr:hypothetical protein EMCG_01487 [Emmonsia crescens UAMH 3008]